MDEPFETGLIFISDRILLGRGNYFLTNEADSPVDGVHQPAVKHPELNAGKRYLQTRSIGLRFATLHLPGGFRTMHFFRLPGKARLPRDAIFRRPVI